MIKEIASIVVEDDKTCSVSFAQTFSAGSTRQIKFVVGLSPETAVDVKRAIDGAYIEGRRSAMHEAREALNDIH